MFTVVLTERCGNNVHRFSEKAGASEVMGRVAITLFQWLRRLPVHVITGGNVAAAVCSVCARLPVLLCLRVG